MQTSETSSAFVGRASTYSKAPDRYPPNAPRLALEGQGAYLTTERGRFIDYTSALGPVILGYAEASVDRAAIGQLVRGVSFSLPTPLERDLIERLVELVPGAGAARLMKNGADTVEAAVRIARAATGRDHVLMYANGYHGARDWCLTRPPKNGGVPSAVRDLTVFCDMHDLDGMERQLSLWRPACLVIEPIVSSDPVLPPDGYFDEVRRLCTRYGVLLILDEIVTGFRVGFPGAVAEYSIDADMVCFGKALGNGWPIGALVGRGELLRLIEDDVFVSSTFGGEAVSIAAALQTLAVLERAMVIDRLRTSGTELMRRYTDLADARGLAGETELYGYPARPVMRWTDPARRARCLEVLIEHGVLCQGYFNLTWAHTDRAVMDQTIEALRVALSAAAAVVPEAA